MPAAAMTDTAAPSAAEPALPLVTVAILAFNRREALAVTLTKLRDDLDYPQARLEVIVVDNASTDGTDAMVRERFPEAQLIVTERNLGIAGWNRAFAAGRGDWFLVLDDDCYLDGDGLRRAIDRAGEFGADMVSFSVDSTEDDTPFSEHYQLGVLGFWGCSVLISRRAIDRLGGYDENIFIWAHEFEFTARLLDAGMTHLVLPEVHSVHMKGLPAFTMHNYRKNMQHFAYIAAKLMRPRDALVALAMLAWRSVLETGVHREILAGLPVALAGFRDGLRVRSPLRPAVSRIYRRDCVEYANFARFVRGPIARRRDRRAPGPLYLRRNLFWEERRAMYPVDRPTAFRVP